VKSTADRLWSSPAALSDWVLAQRSSKKRVSAEKPYGYFLEQEYSASGEIIQSACILLTNAECPWRCLMCDLWKHTSDGPTPAGAIPKQIAFALEHLGTKPQQVKLYNSGSFFDIRAIPPSDYASIASSISFARNVVVECHPRLIGARALEFRNLLSGSLEVAVGLETIHPEILPKLNKRFTVQDFARCAEFLAQNGSTMRVFLLIQPPFMDPEEAVEWCVRSAQFAFECGASAVSLIPTRTGNGALDALAASGQFTPPTLRTVEQSMEAVLELRSGRVFADTWDLERFSECSHCFAERKARLDQMNLRQKTSLFVNCDFCR